MSLYLDILGSGIEFDRHESDLYVRDTKAAREIIAEHGAQFSTLNDANGDPWLEVPFAFDPFWNSRTSKKG